MQVVLEAGVAIYIAMAVALVVWVGIFVYLLRLDAHAKELKRVLLQTQAQPQAVTPSVTVEQRTPQS
jgi:CcmD family protein